MSITAITNFFELARARMLQQFKSECAPNLDNLLNILIQEVQEIEDEIVNLLEERNVTDSVGAQLDIIGSIVGSDREGRPDDEYRAAIRVQIQINSAGGEEPAIAALLGVLTSALTIDILEVFPAGLDIAIDAQDISIEIVQLLRKAIAATVSLAFSQVPFGETPFAFSGSDFGDGFGNLVVPSDGGVFAFVITE